MADPDTRHQTPPTSPDELPPQQTAAPVDEAADSAGLSALANALRICFRLLIVVMLGAILLFLWRSLFVIEEHEVGLILRFGELVGDLPQEQVRDTGLHFTFPYPIDEKVRIPQKRAQTVESAGHWYQEEDALAGNRPPPPTLKPGLDGYTLTGDLGILHSKWSVRFTITSPIAYAFRFHEPDADFSRTRQFLGLLLDRAVVATSASLPIDEAWRDRKTFRQLVQDELDRQLDDLGIGIEAEVFPVEITPPRQVRNSFLDVTRAEQDRSRIKAEAQAYQTRTVTRATTESATIIGEAEGYRSEQVGSAQSDADYFRNLLAQYRRNPEIVQRTLYEETLKRVLTSVDERIIVQGGNDRSIRLQLTSEPKAEQETEGR